MSDLIGRFFSFEEKLGRGLVKFAYFVALFYLVVITLYQLIDNLFDLDLGAFLLVPFGFLLKLLVLRVIAEVLMAILSIEENVKNRPSVAEGFEAGLTATPDRPGSAQPAPPTTFDDVPSTTPAAEEEETETKPAAPATATPTKKATKKTAKKATKTTAKKATKKAAGTPPDDGAASTTTEMVSNTPPKDAPSTEPEAKTEAPTSDGANSDDDKNA